MSTSPDGWDATIQGVLPSEIHCSWNRLLYSQWNVLCDSLAHSAAAAHKLCNIQDCQCCKLSFHSPIKLGNSKATPKPRDRHPSCKKKVSPALSLWMLWFLTSDHVNGNGDLLILCFDWTSQQRLEQSFARNGQFCSLPAFGSSLRTGQGKTCSLETFSCSGPWGILLCLLFVGANGNRSSGAVQPHFCGNWSLISCPLHSVKLWRNGSAHRSLMSKCRIQLKWHKHPLDATTGGEQQLAVLPLFPPMQSSQVPCSVQLSAQDDNENDKPHWQHFLMHLVWHQNTCFVPSLNDWVGKSEKLIRTILWCLHCLCGKRSHATTWCSPWMRILGSDHGHPHSSSQSHPPNAAFWGWCLVIKL